MKIIQPDGTTIEIQNKEDIELYNTYTGKRTIQKQETQERPRHYNKHKNYIKFSTEEDKTIENAYKKAKEESRRLSKKELNILSRTLNRNRESIVGRAMRLGFTVGKAKFKKIKEAIKLECFQHQWQNEIFLQIIRRVIVIKGTLKRFPDGQALGIENKREWENFTSEIMRKEKEILESFDAKGKFTLSMTDEEIIIKYT